MKSTKDFIKKTSLSILIFAVIFGSVFYARPVHAQLAVTKVGDMVEEIKGVLVAAGSAALSSALDYSARRMAYDLAIFVASGGKGQGPLAFDTNFGQYLTQVADDAAGAALDAFTSTALETGLGPGASNAFNICNVPDLRIDLALKISYNYRYASEPPKPRCSFSQFAENWTGAAFRSKYLEPGAVERQFNASLSSEDSSDLGIALKTTEKLDQLVAEQVEFAKLKRTEGEGFKPIENLISGAIKTPAKSVGKDAVDGNSATEAQKKTEAKANAALASGEVATILSTYASVFLDTLAGQIYKNMKDCGVLVGTCDQGGAQITGSASYTGTGSRSTSGQSFAAGVFGSLLVSPIKQLDRYDILSKYSSCNNPNNPGLEECILDQQMVAALQQSAQGNLLTIGDAVEKGIINGNKKLISPQNSLSYDANYCWTQGFCLSNIQKMRKARIVSLGFEIAVRESDPDLPWTLKQVLDGYADPSKPYYHLIDPNWVLKIPDARCNAFGYGSYYNPNILARQEECVDLASCISEDNNSGTCQDYAYCVREKNVWRFSGDACDAQYRTCRAFTDPKGQRVSYIYRTLDTKDCNQNNAGCNVYSLAQGVGGWLMPVASANLAASNTAVHFNGKLSTSCGGSSSGCSAFKLADATYEPEILLRKAPDFFKCYDSIPATDKVDWPQNRADLARIQPKVECSNYSQVCIKDEVGCNWYTPITYNGPRIPGKFTPAQVSGDQIISWGDQCDAKCVGYAAYKEMDSSYANGKPTTYIIPSSGTSCTAQEESCSGFTNMSVAEGGREKVEYFAYLRSCIKPDTTDPTKQKNYFTYEGSVVGGFQLKSYTLAADVDGSSNNPGETGVGPEYWYRTDAEKISKSYSLQCSETLYKSGFASSDCREFNDDAGNIFYRLLSKTVAVDERCTPYRLNSTELASDGLCFQNGELRDNYCYYNGLPAGADNSAGISRGCSKEVESCRAYKGNTGNNIRLVFADNFEGQNLGGWTTAGISLTLSTESTRAGGHSLSFVSLNGGKAVRRLDLTTTTLGGFDISFWAKGSQSTVEVGFYDSNGQTLGTKKVTLGSVGVNDAWRFFHLGPVDFKNPGIVYLVFEFVGGSGNQQLFVDNIELKELTDLIYLVKNSLSVDPICDADQNDNLPGLALGCSAYKDDSNKTFYLTGFSYLCRENALGCTALLDTYNTLDTDKEKTYNIWIPFSGTTGGTASIVFDNNDKISCTVAAGEDGCYTNAVGHSKAEIESKGGVFKDSTFIIPKDTPTSTPIYLVATKNSSCNKTDLGCTLAGALTQTPTGNKFTTTTIKNDPALYDGANSVLCTSEAVGCNAYSSSKGTAYFKDPKATGGKICSYKKDVVVSGQTRSGWFWDGVGTCATGGANCKSDADCGGTGGSCQNIGSTPCYPSYLLNGNYYELWSQGDANYDNFVGTCPAEQNTCSEYLDHTDDQKYYYLNNEKMNQGDCSGEVSQKSGCVLLDRTDNPSKYYNTVATYAASEAQDSQKVAPVQNAGNDANEIIKVQRDRECGEWLKCKDYSTIYNSVSGKWEQKCTALGRCDLLSPAQTSNNLETDCGHWADDNETTDVILGSNLYKNIRDISWAGMDFSGYSIINSYPIEELEQVNIEKLTNKLKDWRLIKRIPCGVGANCDLTAVPPDETKCKNGVDGRPCGTPTRSGVCLGGYCVQSPSGSNYIIEGGTAQSILIDSPSHECRAYPGKDSPYPNTNFVKNSPELRDASRCGDVVGADPNDPLVKECECSYVKATYGSVERKYYNLGNVDLPQGVCVGGVNDGRNCSSNTDCGDSSICQRRTKTERLIGWQGFCVEKSSTEIKNADKNQKYCVTWLPVAEINGVPSISNQHVEAGFAMEDGFTGYYCIKGNVFKQISATKFSVDSKEKDVLINTRAMLISGAGVAGVACLASLSAIPITLGLSTIPAIATCVATVLTGFDLVANAGPYFNAKIDKNNYYCPEISGFTSRLVEGKYYDPTKPVNERWVVGPGGALEPNGFWNCEYTAEDPNKTDLVLPYDVIKTNLSEKSDSNPTGSTLAERQNLGVKLSAGCEMLAKVIDNEGVVQADTNRTWKKEPAQLFKLVSGLEDKREIVNKDVWTVPYSSAYKTPYGSIGSPILSNSLINIPWCERQSDADKNNLLAGIFTLPNVQKERCFGEPLSVDILLKEDGGNRKNMFEDDSLGISFNRFYLERTHTQTGSSVKSTCNFTWDGKFTNPLYYPPSDTGCLESEKIGAARLMSLFPGIQKIYKFDDSYPENKYQSLSPVDVLGDNFINSLGVSKLVIDDIPTNGVYNYHVADDVNPPLTYRVQNCRETGECEQGRLGGISIFANDRLYSDPNTDGGSVLLGENSERVSVRFFAAADPSQMPLRQIKIDWGDNTLPGIWQGLYRNHKGFVSNRSVCWEAQCVDKIKYDLFTSNIGNGPSIDTNERAALLSTVMGSCAVTADCADRLTPSCVPEAQAKNFGEIIDKTCDNTYFEFSHLYECKDENSPGWMDCTNLLNIGGPCCVYDVKVQIKDNWGYCNGICDSGVYEGTDGKCFDNPNLITGKKECELNEGAYSRYNIGARDMQIILPANP